MNYRQVLFAAFFVFCCLSITTSLVTGNDNFQGQRKIQTLPFQRLHTIEVFAGVTKKLQINRQEISKYINHANQQKVMKSFTIQYESILRTAEIYISVFSNKNNNNQEKPSVFDLNQNTTLQQSTVFNLDFLSKFYFNEIIKIQIDIRSKYFSVFALTLMNNQIPDQINLHRSIQEISHLGKIPVWMPYSYDSQNQKFKQITKYFYFKASQNPIKLKINRAKGHPKIFLYNCEFSKFSFCRQQIDQQHIQGTLMLQKQIQITLVNEPNCKNCSIILAIKNMGSQTKMLISQHKIHDSLTLSKDNPSQYNLKAKQSLQVTSYFSFPEKIDSNLHFLDIAVIQGGSSSLKVEFISIESITEQLLEKQNNNMQISQLFKMENQSKAIRIKLDDRLDLSKYNIYKNSNNETWHKIKVKLTAQKNTDFTVIDRNIPSSEKEFISLKDGEIFHSYSFFQSKSQQSRFSQHFKIKVSSLSVLTVSSSCQQINNMTIQYYSQQNTKTLTKISPKVFVENITHYNKKCSQLIHLNPLQLFVNETKNGQKEQKQGWLFFKVSGLKTEMDLLYSSSDIISLEKSFPYHSQLQYNQAIYFHVPNIRNQARIKIQKCSDCQITFSFSQQQLAEIKDKRQHQIITKQVMQIINQHVYQMKDTNGLFVKIRTNNFAHFVITVEEQLAEQNEQLNLNQVKKIENKIQFSLQENNTLTLEFPIPTFLYTNNLNSPTYFSIIQGSINVQVSRQTYCPEFIFSEKERTRDVSISQITPQLTQDEKGNQKYTFSMQVKHHDFFGIRAQKGDEIFSYKVVNIQSMKNYSLNRWSIFHVALFFTFALFMSFVCFMGLKKNRIKKIGGEVVMESQDGQETSMVRLN